MFNAIMTLHSMMSVLPNGGPIALLGSLITSAALDDVSATEWRPYDEWQEKYGDSAALDDVSATEWRCPLFGAL